jgi:hypothetical protein
MSIFVNFCQKMYQPALEYGSNPKKQLKTQGTNGNEEKIEL